MIDKQLLQKRFSKSAETYDQYANVQKAMARRLMGQLDLQHWQGRGTVSILEVGCGTGYLTSLLCKKFPDADITAVEISHRA
jgi:malonyl-CoA O-methyltransferase